MTFAKNILFNQGLRRNFVFIITLCLIIVLFILYKLTPVWVFSIFFIIFFLGYVSAVIFYHIRYYHLNESSMQNNEDTLTNFILHSFFRNIQESLELRDLITIIVQNITNILHAKNCVLYLIESSDNRYYIRGDNREEAEFRDIIFSQKSLLCKFLEHNKAIIMKKYIEDKLDEKVFAFIHKYMLLINAEVLAPIFFDDQLLGFVFLGEPKSAREYTKQDLDTLRIINSEVSISLKNAMSYHELKKNYIQTIDALVMTIEAKDINSKGHSERVQSLAVDIAKELRCSRREIEILRCASMLHDIGKISIDNKILVKPHQLTEEEFEIIKRHPIIGEEIIAPMDFFEDIKSVIRHHHERWDGTGYPDGLSGENISLLARILQVADSFDAMTHSKTYRADKNIGETLAELKKHNGTQFDPDIIVAIENILKNGYAY